jgi:hypothetical protein
MCAIAKLTRGRAGAAHIPEIESSRSNVRFAECHSAEHVSLLTFESLTACAHNTGSIVSLRSKKTKKAESAKFKFH